MSELGLCVAFLAGRVAAMEVRARLEDLLAAWVVTMILSTVRVTD